MKEHCALVEKLVAELIEEAIAEHDSEADAIADHLVRLGRPAVNALLPLVSHDELDVQHYAVEILGRIGDKRVVPLLEELLADTDTDPALLQDVIPALARLRSRSSVRGLIKALKHTNYHRRLDAIHALAKMRAREALDGLQEVAAHDLPIPAREAAIAILYLREGAEGLEKLYHDTSAPVEARHSALARLVAVEGARALPLLVEATTNDSETALIREDALGWICELFMEGALVAKIAPDLIRRIRNEAARVLSAEHLRDPYRLSAACIFRAIAEESDTAFVRRVAENDPYETVREVAREALQRIAARAKT